MSQGYAAKYFESTSLTSMGATVCLSWKAMLFRSRILWELRRVAHSLGWMEKLCKSVKRQRAAWSTALEVFGLSYEQHIVESQKAATARGVASLPAPSADDSECMVEYAVSTAGLAVILLHTCVSRHAKKDREVALHVFAMWFSMVISGARAKELASHDISADLQDQCQSKPHGHDSCSHIRSWSKACAGAGESPPQMLLVKTLVRAYTLSAGGCPALQGWLRQRLAVICEEFSGCMDGVGESDPLKAMHLRGAKRRLRVDKDFKEAVVSTVIRCKRSRTSAAWLRAQGEFHDNLAAAWTEKSLCETLSASRFAFSQGQVFSIAGDCSRVGKPAEETYLAAAYCVDTKLAVWLIPQAS